MLKNNKWKLLISSIVILLPILFGLIFWNELPEQITTHWGIDGKPDGWSNRYFAVFALPIFILITHWLCIFCTVKDPKNQNQNNKVFGIVIWITPLISLFLSAVVYSASFGKEINIISITLMLIGVMFVIIGNYLPKCKQNHTIGIRIKWTLQNEENWNATHRISGKVWVIGGILFMLAIFLPNYIIPWMISISIAMLTLLPFIYSYQYHKKQVREGQNVITQLPKNKVNKIIIIISLTVVFTIFIFIWFIMFSGDINFKYNEDAFSIEASYWNDSTIKYDDIKNIEYRDNDNKGLRVHGFGSARFLAGAFNNEEFGNYTRYSYTKCNSCVVLTVGDRILVISGPDAESTKLIYEKLKSKCENLLTT